MTVRELIDKLSAMPPDVPVVYNFCSDVAELGEGWPRLEREEDKKVVFRQGRFMDYEPYHWSKDGKLFPEQPVFVTVCRFPGN